MVALREAKRPSRLLEKFRMFVMYLCWPPYRRRIDAEDGRYRVLSTTRYLMKRGWSAGRDEAVTILVSKARELGELSRPNWIPRRHGTRPLRRAIRSLQSVVICAECGGQAGENWATCPRCDQRRADEQAGSF